MQTKQDVCRILVAAQLSWSLLIPAYTLGAPFELAFQRRLGAARWLFTRKFVSHKCGGFAGESFSSIGSVEALRASPALGTASLIVESRPKPFCCTTGDNVAVDVEEESSLLFQIVLLAGRQRGWYMDSQRTSRKLEYSVLEEAPCSATKRTGLTACGQNCTLTGLAV